MQFPRKAISSRNPLAINRAPGAPFVAVVVVVVMVMVVLVVAMAALFPELGAWLGVWAENPCEFSGPENEEEEEGSARTADVLTMTLLSIKRLMDGWCKIAYTRVKKMGGTTSLPLAYSDAQLQR